MQIYIYIYISSWKKKNTEVNLSWDLNFSFVVCVSFYNNSSAISCYNQIFELIEEKKKKKNQLHSHYLHLTIISEAYVTQGVNTKHLNNSTLQIISRQLELNLGKEHFNRTPTREPVRTLRFDIFTITFAKSLTYRAVFSWAISCWSAKSSSWK